MTAKPTFINIGPGRCATSWLFQLLQAHPEIALSKVKETEYFNTNFAKGPQWYEMQFDVDAVADSRGGDVRQIGEFSANYYLSSEIAEAIYAYNADMKLIINLRNPYELLKSFHSFGIRRGIEVGELGENMAQPIGPIMGSGYSYRQKKGSLTVADQASLLNSICLDDRFAPYFKRFPREQIYVFVVERLRNEYSEVLQEVFDFLGVDRTFVPRNADEVVNSAIKPKSKMLARAATGTSFALRQMGANQVLTKLHQSKLIKRLLYSKQDRSLSAAGELRSTLGTDACAEIDNQIQLLQNRIPQLENWWSAC